MFGTDLILPIPFIEDNQSAQLTWFVDAGNIYDTNCVDTQQNCFDISDGDLRYSTGLGLVWLSGFGPLTFSIGETFGESEFEDTEFFQFSLGQTF